MTDPKNVVLLLIDLQEPILARARTNSAETVKARASVLMRAAKTLDVPVILSGVAQGKEGPTFIDEVEGAPLVRKGPDALEDAPTLAALHATGRRQVVIAAVLTEVAGYAAAKSAHREGFDVTLLVDACSGTSERTESAVLHTLGLCGIRVLPVATFLASLISDFGKAPGKALLPLMRETYG